jgi:hypothetical protein
MNAQTTTNVSMAQTVTFWAAWAAVTVFFTVKLNDMFGPWIAVPATILIGLGTFSLLTAAWIFLPEQTARAVAEWNKARLAFAMNKQAQA